MLAIAERPPPWTFNVSLLMLILINPWSPIKLITLALMPGLTNSNPTQVGLPFSNQSYVGATQRVAQSTEKSQSLRGGSITPDAAISCSDNGRNALPGCFAKFLIAGKAERRPAPTFNSIFQHFNLQRYND